MFSLILLQTEPLNTFDKKIKCTKDLLQAELCSTLKRRKNVAPIVDPPKYQYPQYNDCVDSAALPLVTNIAKPASLQSETIPQLPSKPSVVDKSKTSINNNHIEYSTIAPKPATTNAKLPVSKPFISHGKPNFTLPRTTDKAPRFGTLESTNDGSVKPKLKPVNNHPIHAAVEPAGKTIVKLPAMDLHLHDNRYHSVAPVSAPHSSYIPSIKADTTSLLSPSLAKVATLTRTYSNEAKTREEEADSGTKKLISHGRPNFIVPSTKKSKVIIESSPLTSKEKCENYLEVKIKSLRPQKSFDGACDRKESFARTHMPTNQYGTAIRSLRSYKSIDDCIDQAGANELHQALSKLRTVDTDVEARSYGKTYNQSGHSTPASELSTDSGNSSPPSSAYGHRALENRSAQRDGDDYTNYEQKTVVSFSKDLLHAPNRYPETIKVTRTITTSHSQQHTTSVAQQTVFNNLKFVIGDNGQVTHANY